MGNQHKDKREVKNKTMYRFLLETKAELLIRRRKEETRIFEQEVAVGNILFAIDKALEKINGE